MVVKGFWIVRRRPATGALSSSLDCGAPFRPLGASVDAREGGWEVSVERLLGLRSRDSDSRFCSAIAETAASTFRSNSSSPTVRLVRSSPSMKEMAPDLIHTKSALSNIRGSTWIEWTDQRRQVIASLSCQLVLVAESKNVLNIRNKVLRVRLEDHIDQ